MLTLLESKHADDGLLLSPLFKERIHTYWTRDKLIIRGVSKPGFVNFQFGQVHWEPRGLAIFVRAVRIHRD